MKLLFLFFAFIIGSCNSINRLYVTMADPKQAIEDSHGNDNVIRIYFDRNGFIYPDLPKNITNIDKDIRNSDARLGLYYQTFPYNYNRLCSLSGITPALDMKTITATNDPLQQYLVERFAENINRSSKDKILVFIIHGFNAHPSKGDPSGSRNNQLTRDVLMDQFKNIQFQFVEIYWDGLSTDNGGQNVASKYLNAVKIWDNAQVSAGYAGLELRRILSELTNEKIYVVTHSHGAGVITNALFNVVKFPSKFYTDTSSAGYDFLQCYNNKIYKTPIKQFYVGMLAPAIPGVNIFDEYYQRTIHTDQHTPLDNYHFIIGFNKYDKVNKKFGLSEYIGATTLGCKEKEVKATRYLFNDNPSIIDVEDFSWNINNEKQRAHAWDVYMANTPHINNFFSKIFPK